MCKLVDAALYPFLDNTHFEGWGFEMIARLCQSYAPSKDSDIYSNFLSLFLLEQGPQDSVDHFVSQIRGYSASLKSGGIMVDPCLLSMFFMKGQGLMIDLTS